jgi:hypothetical protein
MIKGDNKTLSNAFLKIELKRLSSVMFIRICIYVIWISRFFVLYRLFVSKIGWVYWAGGGVCLYEEVDTVNI